jgi:protein TonB
MEDDFVSEKEKEKDFETGQLRGGDLRQVFRDRTGPETVDERSKNGGDPYSVLRIKKMTGVMRQGVTRASVLAGAGVITLGLLGLMIGLISDEFEPKDKIEMAAFEINAEPDELPLLTERTPPKLLDPIEVPPPPSSVDIPVTDRPLEPVHNPSNPGHVFDPKSYIVPTRLTLRPTDTDPTPLVRVPPVMPPRAARSGHCLISFDISSEGATYNVQASRCSQSLFERSAIRSVQKWVYRPKIQDGLPVTRKGLQTVIRFNLTDESGNIIPE